MFRRFSTLARDWWRIWNGDRIRIASTEGRWLRLAMGSQLIIRGSLWEICERQLTVSPFEKGVPSSIIMQYQLKDLHQPASSAVLIIHWNCTVHRGQMSWMVSGYELEELFEDEIQLTSHDYMV